MVFFAEFGLLMVGMGAGVYFVSGEEMFDSLTEGDLLEISLLSVPYHCAKTINNITLLFPGLRTGFLGMLRVYI